MLRVNLNRHKQPSANLASDRPTDENRDVTGKGRTPVDLALPPGTGPPPHCLPPGTQAWSQCPLKAEKSEVLPLDSLPWQVLASLLPKAASTQPQGRDMKALRRVRLVGSAPGGACG